MALYMCVVFCVSGTVDVVVIICTQDFPPVIQVAV